jgi:hypothetical protein
MKLKYINTLDIQQNVAKVACIQAKEGESEKN